MDKQTYQKIVQKNIPKKNKFISSLLAFVSGGTLGVLAQGVVDFGTNVLKLEKEPSMGLAAMVTVFIAAILTMISWYNDLGQIFGAGLFIPTTGFSNSMTSAAIEGKPEGPILGIGTRIFSLAGSVITYGVLSATIFCLIRYALSFVGVNL